MKTEQEALLMLDPKQLDALLHPQFDPEALKAATPVASALAASPGAACGTIVFTAEDAVEPVSYTHLDVYKRQITPLPGWPYRAASPSRMEKYSSAGAFSKLSHTLLTASRISCCLHAKSWLRFSRRAADSARSRMASACR